jgi:hypothetical protein
MTKTEIVHIIAEKLTENEAFELEAKLIYFFGTIYEEARNGVLLNLDLSLRPAFQGRMPKINQPSPSPQAKTAALP